MDNMAAMIKKKHNSKITNANRDKDEAKGNYIVKSQCPL